MRYVFYLILSLLLTTQLEASPQDKTGLNLAWLDTSIHPDQNFYEYANNTWRKENPIPAAFPTWSVANVMNESNLKIIHHIIQNIAEKSDLKPHSIDQKIADFYNSGMDETVINKLGASPLQPEFLRIENMNQPSELQHEMAHLQLIGVYAPLNFDQMQDFSDSTKVIGVASQDGLGLPDRDYYLKKDKKFADIRQEYIAHIERMFKLLGENTETAALNAQTVMKIETALAKSSLSRVAERNPHAVYNIKTLDELQKITPHFDWKLFFSELGYPEIKQINLATPSFFICMDSLLKNLSLNDWKVYFKWRLLQSTASVLSQPFVDESFYLEKKLTGAKILLPRWRRIVSAENAVLGFAIGKIYVEKMFPPSSKQIVQEMVNQIHTALENDLKTVPWMSPETRAAALNKFKLMQYHIGYPEKWRDYSDLQIDRGPYVLNILRSAEFLKRFQLNKIGKPVDRQEWGMMPQEVNAYYDPSRNEFNLLAGILQPPYFNPKASFAVNYGAIGHIIGHEMTHAFDDEGAQFDGYGNLKNWWTKDDYKKFQLATNCIVRQYSNFKENGMSVQGKLVSGEAIADLSGLTLAYNAFHQSPNFTNASSVDGFTPDQQFFIGAAHVSASNIRPEEARLRIITDPHPPANFRVNGVLANMPQFQTAFNIANDSPMINKDKCVIW